MSPNIPGTIVIYGPFFSRTGFGLLARGWALALHSAGLPVKIVPVDCNDPNSSGDLDDTDIYQLHSLKFTPVQTPVTAIFAYVPTYVWPKMPLPEPHLRIMLTTFDSTASAAAPPFRLTFMCNQMDQVWVANRAEEQAWIRGGLEPHRVRSFNWPHTWIDNPLLPPAAPKASAGKPFRFLHISLFLPRRRLDVLLRAFFEEFRSPGEAELYLKMTYPSWHPVPGKPKRDLENLIARLRAETGSKAGVVLDETLGSRLDVVKLIDSCDAYVSTDTTNTAPVSEAIIRNRPTIITDGWDVPLPPEVIVVPNSNRSVAITPEMAEYMPHQRGAQFPALDVHAVRGALRKVVALDASVRGKLVQNAAQYMREHYSYPATVSAAISAVSEGWEKKRTAASSMRIIEQTKTALQVEAPAAPRFNIHWCGLQLFHGKIPAANREICLELLKRGHHLSLVPGDGPFHIEELELKKSDSYQDLARRFYDALPGAADFNVSFRWHPMFKERPAKRQVFGNTWWAGAIPIDWVKPISEYVDDVWVPSKFVRDNFIRGGVAAGQIQVIPLGFNPNVFRADAVPFALRTRKRFKFLYVGETSTRKGMDVLLKAYLRTFSRNDDVCLVIKDINCQDYYARNASAQTLLRCQADPRCPEIEYIDSMLTDVELAGLYAACNCFVQPHRTCSFGLAQLEAMACRLPVITTAFGGVLEFCDETNAFLLPSREIRQRAKMVGHWRVSGEQLSAEIKVEDLQDRMKHVFKGSPDVAQRANLGSQRAHSGFTWSHTTDRVLNRFQALQQAERPARTSSGSANISSPSTPTKVEEAQAVGPTVIVFAPFYNRSGYGVAARALVTALHAVGIRIRIVPVDNVEPGIDDCDLQLLKSLENTPLISPLVALFFHVPSPNWLKVSLPPQTMRIMFTTFDSSAQGNLPPAQWISICNQMDQVWLMTAKEASVFAAAGLTESKIQVVSCPHPWIHNPVLPLPNSSSVQETQPFRFLSIAMFMPRRRWDTLIEAYLTEFKDTSNTELYLKVNYPSWHPVSGQPQRDLRNLIETLRQQTGSNAAIKLDDSLDTRLGICRLVDSCDAYVSTDTSITAPVGEAFVRGKIAVIPDGYGAALPYCEGAVVIPVDPKLTRSITPEMLQYQPHHQGKQMPLLRVDDVRHALRAAYDLPVSQRRQMGQSASLVMECAYGPAAVVPRLIKALQSGFDAKLSANTRNSEPVTVHHNVGITVQPGEKLQVAWEGSFLDYGSLSHVNRELAGALENRKEFSLCLIAGHNSTKASQVPAEFRKLSSELKTARPSNTQVTIRHGWPPDWRRPASGKFVVIQPWEFGALPSEWVANSRHVDEFWVPSSYVRNVYIESGIPREKVTVVPNGIDPGKFRQDATPMELPTRKSFKFLFVGGTIGRKGSDLLLEAYLRSFTSTDDVCLVIKDFGGKSFYSGQTMESVIKAAQARPNAPEILYLDSEMPPDMLPGLYAACDCLVHPYRGEGFGLPILEAMACALPVIVTAGGAADDFALDGFAFKVPAIKKFFGETVSGMKLASKGWLLECRVEDLAERMKWVQQHRDEAKTIGIRACEYVRREWTWQKAAEIAAGRLRHLSGHHRSSQYKRAQTPLSRSPKPLVTPACAKLGDLVNARESLRQGHTHRAWEETLGSISARPFHPEAFLLLAEIAAVVGDGKSARRCAEHARTLAPEWKPVRQFLNRRLKGENHPSWLVLPAVLAPAAAKKGLLLTVCLITKNEEKFLAQCLTSIKGLADQIVVLDTGSTDRTKEIAKSFEAELHQFDWCEDFSAARNAALEHARGQWVLVLDADEELPSDQHSRLKTDLKSTKDIALRLPLVNQGKESEGCSCVPRLFRNAPGVYYTGRIHEQVFPSLVGLGKVWGLGTSIGTAQILHHGYSQETIKDRNKVERNLKLLRVAVDESPDDANLAMNLGLELVRSGDLENGLNEYRRAFELVSSKSAGEIAPELREALLTQFTSQLYRVRAHQDVVEVLTSAGDRLTASLHFALGLAYFELGRYLDAVAQMRQCLAKRTQTALSPINTDILTAAPFHCLAMSLAKAGDVSSAEKAFQSGLAEKGREEQLRLDYARFLVDQKRPVDALHRLHELVAANPACADAWRLGAQIALSRADFFEVALDWTTESYKHFPGDDVIVAQRGEALLLNQQTAEARKVWQILRDRAADPRSEAAIILCDLIESSPVNHSTVYELEMGPVSRALIDWYQRCLALGVQTLLIRVNERLESLRVALPAAASMLEAALAEAGATEPCLA